MSGLWVALAVIVVLAAVGVLTVVGAARSRRPSGFEAELREAYRQWNDEERHRKGELR